MSPRTRPTRVHPIPTGAENDVCTDTTAGSGDSPSMAPGLRERTKTLTTNDEESGKDLTMEEQPGVFVPGARFIFHPYSNFRLGWDVYTILLLVYTMFRVPAAIAFSAASCEPTPPADIAISWIVDVSFWIDMLMNFRTAYIDTKDDTRAEFKLISDPRLIAMSYVRGWFWTDFAGSIPSALVEAIVGGSTGSKSSGDSCDLSVSASSSSVRLARLARLVKLIRLVRVARIKMLIIKARDSLSLNPMHVRLIQLVVFVIVLAHLIACALFGLVSFQSDFPDITWASDITIVVPSEGKFKLVCPEPTTIDDTGAITADSPTQYMPVTNSDGSVTKKIHCMQPDGSWLRQAEPSVQYLMSLYITLTTLTTVGYGDHTMATSAEVMFAIAKMALGASTFAVVVGNLAELLNKHDVREKLFKQRMEDLEDFMHQENVPLDMRNRIRTFFDFGFQNSREVPTCIVELPSELRSEVLSFIYHANSYHSAMRTHDMGALLYQSDETHHQVALHLYHDVITAVPFFKECGKFFLTEIIIRLTTKTLSPGDYLFEIGEAGNSMYFCTKGTLEVVLDDYHGLFAELPEGSYLGEMCVLGVQDHRNVSVRAVTWCSLFCLTQNALEDCLVHHPDAHESFRKLAFMQTSEKTASAALKRLAFVKSFNGSMPHDFDLKKLDDDSKFDHSMDPPVVVRARMRWNKFQEGNKGIHEAQVKRQILYSQKGEKQDAKQSREDSFESLSNSREVSFASPVRTPERFQDNRALKRDWGSTEMRRESDDTESELFSTIFAAQAKARQSRQQVHQEMDALHEKIKALMNETSVL